MRDLSSMAPTGRLRILATSDVHGHVLSHDYFSGVDTAGIGLEATAQLIKQARSEADASILLDNGDFLQGGAISDVAVSLWQEGDASPNPIMTAMNTLKYDAVGLGNHEFNYGLSYLDAVVAQSKCPILCSNMRTIDGDVRFQPWTLIRRTVQFSDGSRQTVTVGVFSVLPPQTLKWDHARLSGQVTIDDMLTAAKSTIKSLRVAKADVIIALAHTGLSTKPYSPFCENGARTLAALEGVDAVVFGHTHLQFPNAGDPTQKLAKPAVQPGVWGRDLGVIDLTLAQEKSGQVTVSDSTATLRHTPSGGAPSIDKGLRKALVSIHQETARRMQHPVSTLDKRLHSYFAALGPTALSDVINAAQIDAIRTALPPSDLDGAHLISATCVSKVGGRNGSTYYTDVPDGPLTYSGLADLYVFNNTIAAVEVNGAQLKSWVEDVSRIFATLNADAPSQTLLDPQYPAYDFDHFTDLDIKYDLSRPIGNGRLASLHFMEKQVEDTDRFVVATNNYRATGGGDLTALKSAKSIFSAPITSRTILQEFLATPPDYAALRTGQTTLSAAAGTRCIFSTGPNAQDVLTDLPFETYRVSGLTPDGRLEIELTF